MKFHWKPLLGVHSVVWDEAQKISGKDPGLSPPRSVGSDRERRLSRNGSSACRSSKRRTSTSSTSICSIRPNSFLKNWCRCSASARLTLNRNPDNFFAETEQVAFHPGHIVSGIDFTNDPLLQGRLFSYTDTQLIRLGGPNFHEIPINRPVAPVHNNQRDGHMRQTINQGRVSYQPNSLGGGCPMQAKAQTWAVLSVMRKGSTRRKCARAVKSSSIISARRRCSSTANRDPEKTHIVQALRFELGKVEVPAIRERMVGLLAQVDRTLASACRARSRARRPRQARQPCEHERAGRRQREAIPT